MIRILIADDHAIVRTGLKALIEQHPDMRVIAEAATGDDAIVLAKQHRPDVAVLDIRMPGISGIEACRQIVKAELGTRVIILTSYAEDELLMSAIQAGAAGYVLKRIGDNELIHAIERVSKGEGMLDPSLTASVFQEVRKASEGQHAQAFSDLTPQELSVLLLVSQGLTNRQIAVELYLGEGTVRNYVSNILSKLGVSNRSEATAYAIRHHINEVLPPRKTDTE